MPVGRNRIGQAHEFACRHPCLYFGTFIAGNMRGHFNQIEAGGDINQHALGEEFFQL